MTAERTTPSPEEAAARRLLEKIRAFVADDLDEEEGALFASLLAPGVSLAYVGEGSGDEVTGFSADFRFDALPDALVETLRRGGIRVEGI